MQNKFLSISSTLVVAAVLMSCASKSTLAPLPDLPTAGAPKNPRAELILDPSEYTELIWLDEFNTSTLDRNKWTPQLGNGCDINLCGWGNNEKQSYTDNEKNLKVSGGNLVITALQEPTAGMAYSSARIRSKNKGDWEYGKIDIRARLPKGQGIWPAIWMLPTDEVFGTWPKSGEIDIMELRGQIPNTVLGTVHYGPDWPNNKYKGGEYIKPSGDFSDDFHVFSVIKSKDRIRWYVDGNLFYSISPMDIAPENYPFNKYFHMILNVAVGGNFLGDPNSTTVFPQQMLIDYVRVYHPK